MSVEAYLKKVDAGAKAAIQKNAEYIASHPYPKDLLAEVVKPLGDKSVLNKIFGPSGRKKSLGSFTPDEIIAAKDEASVYPTLWGDLTSGNTSLILEEKNAIINNSNHETELKNAYSQFREKIPVEQKVAGSSEFTVNYIFKNLPDKDFLDEIALQTDFELDFNLNTYGADDLVKAAFMELYEKDSGVKPGSQPASTAATSTETSGSDKSPVNSTATQSTSTEEKPASSINSTTVQTPSNSATSNPINPTSTKSSEPTAVTSLDGGVTSKAGELQTENILDTNPSQAINVNLENKPTESKPATGPTSNSTTATTTSNSTTVNDVNSTSSVTSNPSNTSTNTGVTGDKNIMKVENTNNQSSSSTVNESKPEKEKGGFLSKVGNFAKKAGAALNLPSVGELGEQAKGLFGAAGANIGSRISEVKNSFSINSRDEESNSAPTSSTSTNSAPTSSTSTNSVNSSNTTTTTKPNDILAVPNTGTTSNTSDILKTETQTAMNVEQNKPAVTATSALAPVSNLPGTSTSTAVSNTTNSQNTSSPTTTTSNTSQNTQSAGQPAGSPAGVGVNVDMNQLAQSITRLERILISGIEVTIKDA